MLVKWDRTTTYLKTVFCASKDKVLRVKKEEYNLGDSKLTKTTISFLDALPEDKMN